MPTNQEWLHKLANESPDELKAWFEAEHVYDMDNAECVHMCPNEANDENQRESGVSGDDAHSNDGNAHLKASEDLSDGFTDSREKLEADVYNHIAISITPNKENDSVLAPYTTVLEWLDRQAAITNAAWKQLEESWITAHDSLLIENGELREEVDRLQRRNDELRTSYDKLMQELEAAKSMKQFSETRTDASHCAFDVLKGEYDRLEAERDKLQSYVDDATADYAKLVKERDNLADDLLTCNREREQLRKHLGIALDHAHDICTLVDIDGNVLDVGE